MPTPAFDHPVPAPFDADFVNGELAVGLSANSVMAERYFAREFVAPRSGLYLMKVWLQDGGDVFVGRDRASLRQLITMPQGGTVVTQVVLEKGVNRIDLIAYSSIAEFFAMLIFHPDEVIYASSAEGWVAEVGDFPTDISLPNGQPPAAPVFPLLPNWADGITERVSYLTDILTSESAAEQTRLLRMHPRREFEAAFLRKGVQRSRLDAFLVGIGRRTFLMPLWHEQYRTAQALSPAAPFVQFPDEDLALREFMVGDKVLITNGDPDDYEILEVGSLDYNLDRLYWVANPARSWSVGTRLIPLRKARITDQAQMSAPVDQVGRVSLRFALEEPEYRFGASWGRCSPVWHFPINRAEELTFSYDRLTYSIDNNVGPIDYFTPGDRALITMRSALILRGRASVVAFRRFIDQAGGRASRFYMPTRMSDLQPSTQSLGGVNLDVLPQGFAEYNLTPQRARGIIGVVFRDGSPNLYRRIDDVRSFGSFERFVLSLALPPIETSNIERIQYMVPSRFDQDAFEFAHLVDDSAAVRTTVVTRSVDGDGMPEIDCFVTSEPYPVEAMDALSPAISFIDANLIESPQPVEEMSPSFTPESAVLRVALQAYNGSPESIDATFGISAGQLYEPLRSIGADLESLNVSLGITAGGLRVALLTEGIEPEGVDVSFALTSGTLT